MTIPINPDALRGALIFSVDALHRRQANEIPEATLAALIERDWLEWHGGTLRLTTTGQNIHRRELAQSKADAAGEAPGRPTTLQTRSS